MLDDLTWRKMPRNIIRDEVLDYVAEMLPEELAAAPLVFYLVAYCKADDEGMFTVGNGVIFSRLMKMCMPEQVIEIANLLCEYEKLTCISNEKHIYMINDWEAPKFNPQKTKSMDERRQSVQAKIDEAERQREATRSAVNFRPNNPFFCPQNDKFSENVVNTQTDRHDRLDMTEDREIKTNINNTHTNSNKDFDDSKLIESDMDYRNYSDSLTADKTIPQDIQDLTNQALSHSHSSFISNGQNLERNDYKTDKAPLDTNHAYVVLKSYFAKNCLGFSEVKNARALQDLSRAIKQLESPENPADTIATVFCTQFSKLSNDSGYYHNCPITPEQLLKPGIYKTVLGMASKILCSKTESRKMWDIQEKAAEEAQKNKTAINDELQQQYIQYGIDPNSSKAFKDFMIKTRQGQN